MSRAGFAFGFGSDYSFEFRQTQTHKGFFSLPPTSNFNSKYCRRLKSYRSVEPRMKGFCWINSVMLVLWFLFFLTPLVSPSNSRRWSTSPSCGFLQSGESALWYPH
ncbi:hypothetical protein ES332_D11G229000v1 [Gossypium tomentosum]|uniref:Uncharacterized protein n=1 Tax=Gossypium tomentosum TaxID=34277 RepID=A0A5D2IS22_GOSTO|nr:hypothetical protein ES332_D11G229000v1 [Gossypium tomentosum]